jgi:hypothetical protein
VRTVIGDDADLVLMLFHGVGDEHLGDLEYINGH